MTELNRRTLLTAIMALPFVRWLPRTNAVVVANRTHEWKTVDTDCISMFRHLETGELKLFPTENLPRTFREPQRNLSARTYNPMPPGTQWERLIWDSKENSLVTFVK